MNAEQFCLKSLPSNSDRASGRSHLAPKEQKPFQRFTILLPLPKPLKRFLVISVAQPPG